MKFEDNPLVNICNDIIEKSSNELTNAETIKHPVNETADCINNLKITLDQKNSLVNDTQVLTPTCPEDLVNYESDNSETLYYLEIDSDQSEPPSELDDELTVIAEKNNKINLKKKSFLDAHYDDPSDLTNEFILISLKTYILFTYQLNMILLTSLILTTLFDQFGLTFFSVFYVMNLYYITEEYLKFGEKPENKIDTKTGFQIGYIVYILCAFSQNYLLILFVIWYLKCLFVFNFIPIDKEFIKITFRAKPEAYDSTDYIKEKLDKMTNLTQHDIFLLDMILNLIHFTLR